jgi:general secretion pathway protein I
MKWQQSFPFSRESCSLDPTDGTMIHGSERSATRFDPIRSRSRLRAAEAGFTLLEVVVAVAIAGLALVALFQAGSGGLFATDTAARAEEALQRAQSHLAAVGRDAALVQGDASGDDGGGFHWRLQVQPAAQRQTVAADGVTPQNTTLYSVQVAVSWQSRGHQRAVVLRTLRLGTEGTGG